MRTQKFTPVTRMMRPMFLLSIVLFALLGSTASFANPAAEANPSGVAMIGGVAFVDQLTNLPADFAVMREQHIPMMIFFHASYCGYCEQVDDQFLIPMRKDPEFQNRLLIRRVKIDADTQYIGLDGKPHDYPFLANQLGVRGVPYVVFLAPDGSRITSIQGTAYDYYGYYLSKDINLATECAKKPGQPQCNGNKDGPGL